MKSAARLALGSFIMLALVAAVTAFIAVEASSRRSGEAVAATEPASTDATATGETPAAMIEPEGEQLASVPQEVAPGTAGGAVIIPLRGMGDPKAPARIDEYASLSCSHCANFHKNNLPQIKAELIDAGKVYFVFNDFPLNAPALEAAIIGRCMPEDRYFQFIGFVFEQQAQWTTQPNYVDILRQNAKLLGATDEQLDKCLADDGMRKAIAENVKVVAEKHSINSTPSFVVNGKDLISGEADVEAFKKAIGQ